MQLLDLPVEVLRLILGDIYQTWDLVLWVTRPPLDYSTQHFEIPNEGIAITCHLLHALSQTIIETTFTGVLLVDHLQRWTNTILPRFPLESIRSRPRARSYLSKVHTIRFSNKFKSPSLWQVRIDWDEWPTLQHLVLDCRYQHHFSIHTAGNMKQFLDGTDGEMVKLMDFRRTFFLTCEKFINDALSRGRAVTVIREMGVREGIGRCMATAVAIDYIHNANGTLMLDTSTLRHKQTTIDGWPSGIRQALSSLEI